MAAGQPEGSGDSSSSSAGSHVAGPKRELQKARKESESEDDGSVFKAFTGSAYRIDGKRINKSSSETKDSKEDIAAKRLAAMSRGNIDSGNGSNGGGSGSDNTAGSPPIVRQSRIGDKYAKKKNAVSAFTGSGNKLG